MTTEAAADYLTDQLDTIFHDTRPELREHILRAALHRCIHVAMPLKVRRPYVRAEDRAYERDMTVAILKLWGMGVPTVPELKEKFTVDELAAFVSVFVRLNVDWETRLAKYRTQHDDPQ